MKKPLNQIETPVYPDIKKGPPRFVWSRKHYEINAGETLRDTEPYTQFYENAILAQSRDYNQTVYGISSHKDTVNSEFRPPIQSPYEDFGPITRIPCTIHSIIPHINPGTAGHDGGTSSYSAKNQRPSDIEGALTDRIKDATWRPTFYAPMDAPIDNSVLPDLEVKIPNISIDAGWYSNYNSGLSDVKEITQLKEKIFVKEDSGVCAGNFTMDAKNVWLENYQTKNNKPNYSIGSGMNTPIQQTNTSHLEGFVFDYNIPQISSTAGVNNPYKLDGEVNHNYDLQNNIPSYSVSSGKTSEFTSSFEIINHQLNKIIPQYSTTSGINTNYTADGIINHNYNFENNLPSHSITSGQHSSYITGVDERNYQLNDRLDHMPISVLNPGSEDTNYYDLPQIQTLDNVIRENKPSYSYTVPYEIPTYRTKNSDTIKHHFVKKIEPIKGYGNMNQSSGFIPRFGIDQPRKDFGGSSKAMERMGYAKKKVQYKM